MRRWRLRWRNPKITKGYVIIPDEYELIGAIEDATMFDVG